ncbi:hypothetical protein J4468_01915 [Candidatus Woesearchaeota archaeon]|nr:hypothetical protein [Candidatus Woesearchaeota archaeon]
MANDNNGFISEVLYRLNVGSEINLTLLEKAFDKILNCDNVLARDVQLGALLTGIMAKGPKVEEIVTLLKCAFKLDNFLPYDKIKIDLPSNEKLVGAIGSGKKGFKTMNISTPAMLLATAAGAYTAKPVSSSTSSMTGSADLLRELGVNIDIPTEKMIKTIKDTGFGAFCIENLIPKFDNVYGKKFYVPHTLSFGLAALLTPVHFDNFLYGLAHPDVETSIRVLKEFDIQNAMVVSATNDDIHYLDEMGIYGTTRLVGIKNGKIGKLIIFRPTEELNLPQYEPHHIAEGDSLKANVQYCVDVIRGYGEKPREDIVCINAGTILYLAEKARDLKDGFNLAKKVIKSGAVLDKLIEVIHSTGGNKSQLDNYLR